MKKGKTLQRIFLETLRFENNEKLSPKAFKDLAPANVEKITEQPPLPSPYSDASSDASSAPSSVDPWETRLSAEARLHLGIPEPKPPGIFERMFKTRKWDPE